MKFNISTYGYREDVVDTVNIPNCEDNECDVVKQCSMFHHNSHCNLYTQSHRAIEVQETSQFQLTRHRQENTKSGKK